MIDIEWCYASATLEMHAGCMQAAFRLHLKRNAGCMQPACRLHACCCNLHAGCCILQPPAYRHNAACMQPACISSVALALGSRLATLSSLSLWPEYVHDCDGTECEFESWLFHTAYDYSGSFGVLSVHMA